MQIADCPNCAFGNELDNDVAFGNIECKNCKNVFHWTRNKAIQYLECCNCGKVLSLSNMYTVDACSEKCQDKLNSE